MTFIYNYAQYIREAAVVLLLLFTLLSSFYVRAKRKSRYEASRQAVSNSRELEALTLEFNKQNQFLNSVQVIAVLIAVFLSFLVYDVQAFSVTVLGIGAILVILRESVSSFIASFLILASYEVGDDIKMGDSLGEIATIKLLSTSIVGKEETGEYNGKLIHIPNFLFLQQKVEVQELKTTNYRLASILLTQQHDVAKASFEELVTKTRTFLDGLLPVRSVNEIGHFKNYAGRRYRLYLDYSKDGFATMRIAFVTHPDNISELREKIMGFLERER